MRFLKKTPLGRISYFGEVGLYSILAYIIWTVSYIVTPLLIQYMDDPVPQKTLSDKITLRNSGLNTWQFKGTNMQHSGHMESKNFKLN